MPKTKKIASHVQDMSTTVDAAIAITSQVGGLLPTHRQCSFKIENKCSDYTLSNPSVYIESGQCTKNLPLTIDPSSHGTALFTKTPNTARGAVGVFTYDLIKISTKESTEKVAVMFSVPYDFNMYSNWLAVGIFDKSRECNYDLYYHMYNGTESTFVREKAGSGLSHKNDQVTILASMTNSYEPEIKVKISES